MSPAAFEGHLRNTLRDTARVLECWPRPVTESVLEEISSFLLREIDVVPVVSRQYRLSLAGFPGVGHCDLAAGVDTDGAEALLELKWGAGTLYNCVWDFAKLGLALREGAAQAAYLIAGAPLKDWNSEKPGVGLFTAARWDTGAFMEFYADCFEFWRGEVNTRPIRLPDEISAEGIESVPLEIQGQPWELRCSRVSAPETGWVTIDGEGVATPELSALETEQVTLAGRDEVPADDLPLTRMRSFEGGAIYLAGERGVYVDDGALADFAPPEELEGVDLGKLLRFHCTADRDAYLRNRGWLEPPKHRAEIPLALELSVGGADGERTITWDGFSLTLQDERDLQPRPAPVSSPSPDAWRGFLRLAEELEVWTWHRWYTPERMATDGDFWSFLLAASGRMVHARGYRAFPPHVEPSSTSVDALLAAGEQLAGITSS